MSEVFEIILAVVVLCGAYIVSRYLIVWRLRRAAEYIVRELENRKALDIDSAVELPYMKKEFFRIGLRDYRPKAMASLVQEGVVGRTEDGKFYLREHPRSISG